MLRINGAGEGEGVGTEREGCSAEREGDGTCRHGGGRWGQWKALEERREVGR